MPLLKTREGFGVPLVSVFKERPRNGIQAASLNPQGIEKGNREKQWDNFVPSLNSQRLSSVTKKAITFSNLTASFPLAPSDTNFTEELVTS